MVNSAIVVSAGGGLAVVELRRSSACGDNCQSCGACDQAAKKQRFTARDPIGAAVGDRVLVEISTKVALGATALVFSTPVVLGVAGLLITPWLGAVGFALGIGIAVAADRLAAKRRKIPIVILRRE